MVEGDYIAERGKRCFVPAVSAYLYRRAAVAARPPIILADEPTGNLDSHSGKEVMKILHELNDEGRTIILITHDNEIAEEGTRVVRISDGRIIEDRPSNRV